MTAGEYYDALEAERHIKCVLEDYRDIFPDEINDFLLEIRVKLMEEAR